MIHETQLPRFLDLVIWGHEHESIVGAQDNQEAGFYVIQPGSSLPTSLTELEAKPKHVFILEVKGDQFRTEFLPLKKLRPYVFDEVCIADADIARVDDTEAFNYLAAHVERILQRLGEPEELEKLPLVRLRVDVTGLPSTNALRNQVFGQKFIGRVANPEDMLILQRNKKRPERGRGGRPGAEGPRLLLPRRPPPRALPGAGLQRRGAGLRAAPRHPRDRQLRAVRAR